MNYIAFIPTERGTQPTGADKTIIIRELKTSKGAIKRALSRLGNSIVVYSYTALYDEKTWRQIYNSSGKIITL